ncbi:MAG TPA: hypothetical protein VH500_05305 [Nitrososphaeraceae archaeon]
MYCDSERKLAVLATITLMVATALTATAPIVTQHLAFAGAIITTITTNRIRRIELN